MWRAGIAIVASVVVTGCGSDGSGPEIEQVVRLASAGGEGQVWYFGNPLPMPYAVTALDSLGVPLAGVEVAWVVASGGGTVDPARTVTGADGTARATHTLGPDGTSHSVIASVRSGESVTFVANGLIAPTEVVVTVGNDFFSPRDAVVKVGGTVTWIWRSGGMLHNVIYTAGSSPLPAPSATQGEGVFSTTFNRVSRFDYVCTLHAGMEATVTVVR